MTLDKWYTSITISVPGSPNNNNDITYTSSTILGRLVETEERVQLSNGEIVIANAKLFTSSELILRTKIGDHLIISGKTCKDKSGVVQFYKYYLK
jgi:hypothetical protein